MFGDKMWNIVQVEMSVVVMNGEKTLLSLFPEPSFEFQSYLKDRQGNEALPFVHKFPGNSGSKPYKFFYSG